MGIGPYKVHSFIGHASNVESLQGVVEDADPYIPRLTARRNAGGKTPKRCLWQMQRGVFKEAARFSARLRRKS